MVLRLQKDPEALKQVKDEMAKLQNLGFIVKLKDLPESTQKQLNEDFKHFIPTTITCKETSASTKTRICWDSSRCSKQSASLNSILLNTIINNINLSGLSELNTIYACVLHKGHGKNTEESRSYRTISTCPLISKALDKHVRNLSVKDWNSYQAPTQYQGEKRSHELACILLTETIHHSVFTAKKPVYALFLDARSAFDRVLRRNLVRNMFFSGTDDQRLLYIDHRLSNRHTFCEFDHQLMGPILDTRGLEQGGIFSSDSYKIYNNEQVLASQRSNLGVNIYS